MYIIACRAHFCHLPGLSQVGHSPRETSGGDGTLERGSCLGLGEVGHSPRGISGGAGTLDWGPMWLGSQSTCHPPKPPDTSTPHASPSMPLHSLTPVGSLGPYTLFHPNAPWHPLPAPHAPTPFHPDDLYTPNPSHSNAPWHPTPLASPLMPYTPYPLTPRPPDIPYTSASPQCPYIPFQPPDAPTTLTPCWPPEPYTPCHPNALDTPYTPCWPSDTPTPPDVPSPQPVGMLRPWNRAQCGWAPSPPATPNAPTPSDTPDASRTGI